MDLPEPHVGESESEEIGIFRPEPMCGFCEHLYLPGPCCATPKLVGIANRFTKRLPIYSDPQPIPSGLSIVLPKYESGHKLGRSLWMFGLLCAVYDGDALRRVTGGNPGMVFQPWWVRRRYDAVFPGDSGRELVDLFGTAVRRTALEYDKVSEAWGPGMTGNRLFMRIRGPGRLADGATNMLSLLMDAQVTEISIQRVKRALQRTNRLLTELQSGGIKRIAKNGVAEVRLRIRGRPEVEYYELVEWARKNVATGPVRIEAMVAVAMAREGYVLTAEVFSFKALVSMAPPNFEKVDGPRELHREARMWLVPFASLDDVDTTWSLDGEVSLRRRRFHCHAGGIHSTFDRAPQQRDITDAICFEPVPLHVFSVVNRHTAEGVTLLRSLGHPWNSDLFDALEAAALKGEPHEGLVVAEIVENARREFMRASSWKEEHAWSVFNPKLTSWLMTRADGDVQRFAAELGNRVMVMIHPDLSTVGKWTAFDAWSEGRQANPAQRLAHEAMAYRSDWWSPDSEGMDKKSRRLETHKYNYVQPWGDRFEMELTSRSPTEALGLP